MLETVSSIAKPTIQNYLDRLFLIVILITSVISLNLFFSANPLAQTNATQIQDLQKADIQEIQRLLTALGYKPGPADGFMGKRTTQAILAFEKEIAVPLTGKPSNKLIKQLKMVLSVPKTTSSTSPPAATTDKQLSSTAAKIVDGRPAPANTTNIKQDNRLNLSGTRWRIIDADGATLELTFRPEGKVTGTANNQFWRWEHKEDKLHTYYDNGWGGRINRTGTLKDQEISGIAVAGHGKKWNWRAVRVPATDTPSPFSDRKSTKVKRP